MGFGAGASRAERKAKKRKIENSIPDIPLDLEETEPANESISSTKRKRGANDASDAQRNAGSTAKGAGTETGAEVAGRTFKRTKVNPTDSTSTQNEEHLDAADIEDAPKKTKKERKAERKAKEAALASAPKPQEEAIPIEQDGLDTTSKTQSQQTADKPKTKKKKQKVTSNAETESKAARFIVFIGNLPFTATTASIQKHFAPVKPISVRHQTEKGNATKSKGYAFLEFEGYDHMKTCLKQFHHSMFKDDISAPRKINVELTAGGGGNTKDRRSKILGKNQKLNEQRIRQAQEEVDNKSKGNKASGAEDASQLFAGESGMHPSRRARVTG